MKKILFLITTIGIILSGSFSVTAQTPEVAFPEPTGKYKVGRMIFDWTDDAREETFTTATDDKRRLMMFVWYPAEPAADAIPADYLPGKWNDILAQNFFGISRQTLRGVRIHTYDNAPLASDQPSYPVLLFSPGFGLLPPAYTAIMEELASYGFIIIGITPTYSAPIVVFSDGSTARFNQAAGLSWSDILDETDHLNEVRSVWIDDMVFAANQAEKLNADDPMFAGRLDLEKLGAFGHSFGGATTLEFCRIDARCKAGANMDGMPFGKVIDEGLSQPFMIMRAEAQIPPPGAVDNADRIAAMTERTNTRFTAVFDGVKNSAYIVSIRGAAHLSFSDQGIIAPLVPRFARELENVTVDHARTLRITDDYLLSFFAKHLLGVDASLLATTSAPDAYPEVEFTKKD